jgi:hypothetical protein
MRETIVDATSLLADIAKLINQEADARLASSKWIEEEAKRARQISKYRQYMDGSQDTGMTKEARTLLNLKNAEDDFHYNMSAQVVREISNRIEVKEVTAIGTGAEAATDWLGEVREWNWFEELQIDLHDAIYRDGDSYVMVSFDDEADMPVLTHELAFDGTNGVLVVQNVYDRAVVDVAVKVWSEPYDQNQDKTRINIYFPDRVVKVQKIGAGQLTPYEAEGETEDDLKLVARDGSALGVPIIKFSTGATTKGGHGVSKLHDVVPLQHALNATLHSTVGAALLSSFPINLLYGFKAPTDVGPGMFVPVYPTDKEGKKLAPSPEVNEYLKSMKAQQLQAADLNQHIDVMKYFQEAIGAVGNLPNTEYGANESGEAKKQRESKVIAEAKRSHVSFGGAYSRLFDLCVAMKEAYSRNRLRLQGIRWRVVWADPETRNDNERAELLATLEPIFEGSQVILKQAATLLGLDDEEVDKIIAQKEAAQRSTADAILSRLPGVARNSEGQQGNQLPSGQVNGQPSNLLNADNQRRRISDF